MVGLPYAEILNGPSGLVADFCCSNIKSFKVFFLLDGKRTRGGEHLPLQRYLGSPEKLQLKDTSVVKGCIQEMQDKEL